MDQKFKNFLQAVMFLSGAGVIATGGFIFGFSRGTSYSDAYLAAMQKEYPIVEFVGNAEYVCRRVNPEEKKQ